MGDSVLRWTSHSSKDCAVKQPLPWMLYSGSDLLCWFLLFLYRSARVIVMYEGMVSILSSVDARLGVPDVVNKQQSNQHGHENRS